MSPRCRIKTIVAVLLITTQLSLYLAFFPSPARAADGGAGWTNVAKELGLDLIGRTMAQLALTRLLNMIVNKVQDLGRDGGPAFVREWSNFASEAQYRGEDRFRTILANTQTCAHLRGGLDAAYNANPRFKQTNLTGSRTRVDSLDPFTLRARCTLPQNFNLGTYLENPSENGGWEAFLRLSQPENSAIGLAMMAGDELIAQRDLQEEADVNEADSGQGYTAARERCEEMGGGARCVKLQDINTPGDYLAQVAPLSAEKLVDFVTQSDETTEGIVVNAIASVLVSIIFDRMSNLANSEDQEFSQADSRDQRANEYCTIQPPRDDVDEEFKDQFDLSAELGACPHPDQNNLSYVGVCVQQCLQALGLLDAEIEVEGP